MKGPEAKFWADVRDNTKTQVFWQRLESPGTGLGIPDVLGACNNKLALLELKCVTKGWRIKFEPEQPVWLHKCARKANRSFVVCKRVEELYVWRGEDARALRGEHLQSVEPILHYEYKSDWDWDRFVWTIFS